MESWARAMPKVQFLCVCVDSRGVALQFGRMFQFKHAVNSYIPSREYMPVGYGQLGCSGFVVVDKKGHFVSRKTNAFLQHGEDAFNHVEELLAQELGLEEAIGQDTTTSGAAAAAPLSGADDRYSEGSHVARAEKEGQEGEKESSLDNSAPLSSVGVQSMDREHERCAEALTELLKTLTTVALLRVLKELESHFDHEEALMKEHGFGGSNSRGDAAFSAFASHVSDHKKILDIGQNELQRLFCPQKTSPSFCGKVP
jgi:hypothetical protein